MTIPLILLREAIGHVVVVELGTKDEYRGLLKSAEDSMNVTLSKVVHTNRVGQKATLEEVFLRGSAIRLFVLPDMLVNAPVLRSVAASAVQSSTAQKEKRTRTKDGDNPNAKRQKI